MEMRSRPREGDTGLYQDATGVRGKFRKGLSYPLPTITLYITTLVLVFALVDPQGMGLDRFVSLFPFVMECSRSFYYQCVQTEAISQDNVLYAP